MVKKAAAFLMVMTLLCGLVLTIAPPAEAAPHNSVVKSSHASTRPLWLEVPCSYASAVLYIEYSYGSFDCFEDDGYTTVSLSRVVYIYNGTTRTLYFTESNYKVFTIDSYKDRSFAVPGVNIIDIWP